MNKSHLTSKSYKYAIPFNIAIDNGDIFAPVALLPQTVYKIEVCVVEQ